MADVWAYIAHKDGKWAGLASADMPKKELKKFIGDFVVDGFQIMPVYDRAEYERVLASMDMWERPAKKKKPAQAELI